MTADREPSATPRRRSLRRRVVATFTALAIVPFALTVGGLFLIVRQDVAEIQGASLAQEARLLAGQIRLELLNTDFLAANVAALPQVRRYLDRAGPYPEATLAVLRQTLPGLRNLELRPGVPAEARRGVVAPGAPGQIDYEIPLDNSKGDPAAVLFVSQDAGGVRRLLDSYRKGEEGRAVLLDPSNRILAGPTDVSIPAPSPQLRDQHWIPYRVPGGGVALVAGAHPIDSENPALRNWTSMVVQPASEIFAEFHRAAGQAVVVLLLLAAAGLVVAWRLGNQFLSPVLQLRQGAEIISRINLGHRLRIETGDELEELAQEFNRMAESLQGAYEGLGERVRDATVHLQEERNRLAAVLRTMVEGVIVANQAGEVLLMNPRARIALDSGPSSGIGAPLGRVLPAARIEYHMRRLRAAWTEGREAVERVVLPLSSGKLLLGLISAVPGPGGERAGYMLVFRDLGSELEEEKAKASLRELPELLKGPLSSLQSLAEALLLRPDVTEARRKAFLEAIRDEALRLTERLRVAEDATGAVSSSRWPSLPADPRELIREAMESAQGVYSQIDVPENEVPQVLVEPFSWISALSSVLRWTAERSSGWSPVEIQLSVEEETVVTTFRLQGPLGDPRELEQLIVAPPGEQPLPLGEAVRRNRGELWGRRAGESFEIRMALLRASIAPSAAAEGGIVDQQPEFYDFDLFLPRPTVEGDELLRARLADLECVVFDTETTGLNPSRGDEVVSLSAIRIRRGRVMAADTFHTLVNPRRPIPSSSIQFHGIDDSMVTGAPTMAEVLPRFREYVRDSVLVAHNAAFDKKFLDIAAQKSRMPTMDNPILDTLFLSYGIHKDFAGHHLDAIAHRLGVAVEGRHTSVGDARATAEIFLRLIPLLAAREIVTLADAKAFCDKMLLLRWQTSRF